MERRVLSDALDLFDQCACLCLSARQLMMLPIFIGLSAVAVSTCVLQPAQTCMFMYGLVNLALTACEAQPLLSLHSQVSLLLYVLVGDCKGACVCAVVVAVGGWDETSGNYRASYGVIACLTGRAWHESPF